VRPAQAMHLSVVTRDVDRDQEAGLAFLSTPRANDFQGSCYSANSVPPSCRTAGTVGMGHT